MAAAKRRWRQVLFMRRLLVGAITVLALVALLSVHVQDGTQSPNGSNKLPVHDVVWKKLRGEVNWMLEFAPPHPLKAPLTAHKLDDGSGSLDSKQQGKKTPNRGYANVSLGSYKLWKPQPNRGYVPCIEPNSSYTKPPESRGYLVVHANGGLNQMVAGICDMVAIARILNATLVIPSLDKHSLWQDSSNFSDVFDENHFINSLVNDVRVIKKLPKEVPTAARISKSFISWSGVNYYEQEIARLWDRYQVIRAEKSDSRLANNNIPLDIQKLRCRACYEALQFAPHIETMGKLLVKRMRSHGHYIALHLRFEKDMLAFSGCTHDLTPDEADELKRIRENTTWWKVKDIDPVEQRAKGYCPLTPKEVGIFLNALGFPSSTPIYIAAGEIYGGETRMADLRTRYPILINKEKLASPGELEPFINHASQLAALDYTVSVESDIFIPTYTGNMARAVEGRRRFFGHRKTISPDRKTLVRLFDKIENGTICEGKNLSNRIYELHRRRQGSPRKRRGPRPGTKGMDRFRSEDSFYSNPLPDCLCQKESAQTTTR